MWVALWSNTEFISLWLKEIRTAFDGEYCREQQRELIGIKLFYLLGKGNNRVLYEATGPL
jgi:hypothetical protein